MITEIIGSLFKLIIDAILSIILSYTVLACRSTEVLCFIHFLAFLKIDRLGSMGDQVRAFRFGANRYLFLSSIASLVVALAIITR